MLLILLGLLYDIGLLCMLVMSFLSRVSLDDLNTRIKLILTDVHNLTELCLIKSYFLYENKIRLSENVNLIGLSLSGNYLQHLQSKAIAEVLTIERTFKRYIDDTHAHFPTKHETNTFQKILK